ncbi:cytochrome o ubiquinol oxidase subunit IV [Pleomorphomonas sp. NRK KF1]|uniref:cytochrome o ubiquinol oxidase subunit IV n=1 Tax=Pleomorphomonas sp. NRK KF1 TaxID=2943000 RepID=UPI0020446C75|nr:cytochrome o ubiquinol oxidase subunit IV [Pleomorphomonas sp. NRK KF1]MCM5555925.1 cytochrome o ubiquinol oxidase subunit IV [Pleomorphomonas sp. NRK KF1]
MADRKTEHLPGAGASLHHYARGMLLSVILTLAAFALVMTGALPRNATIFVILVLAAIQIFVHLVDFLHIDGSLEQRWNVYAALFALLVVGILVGGSIWIMFSAHERMKPDMPGMTMPPETF